MMFTETRGRRARLLLMLITAGVLSYFSFDNFVRPHLTVVPLYSPLAASPEQNLNNTAQHEQNHLQKDTKILLVSAFFPLTKSKHTMNDYRKWLRYFLGKITTDVYFYTSPEMESLVREERGDLPIVINTTFSTPFGVPPLQTSEEWYHEMVQYDRESYRHSVDLYAVWNAKPYLLDAALKASPKTYDYAFWNDAGSFRSPHFYSVWPDPARVNEVWKTGSQLSGTKEEDLLFFPITGVPDSSLRLWTEDMGPIDSEMSEGSFFGGSPKTIDWWQRTFYSYHNFYILRHFFVGKDQTLINAILVLFPSRVITVWHGDSEAPERIPEAEPHSLGTCGSDWFYYQFWLASPVEQARMGLTWLHSWHWDFWKVKLECRVTRVLVMKDVFKRVFGNEWSSPARLVFNFLPFDSRILRTF